MNLFQRQEAGNYYVRFMVRKRRYMWCTKTDDKKLARGRAKAYREAIVAKEYTLADSMKSRTDAPTFDKLFEAYLTAPIRPSRESRLKCIASMRRVLQTSGYDDKSRLDVVDAGLALRYMRAEQEGEVNPSTINNRLRHARAIFSKGALITFDPPLKHPGIEDFKRVPLLRVPEQLRSVPDDAVLARIHELLPDSNPAAYRAFLLAAYAGLRAGEVKAATWSWLEGDILYVGGKPGFTAKSQRWRVVRLAPEVIEKLGPRGEPDTPICGEHSKFMIDRQLPTILRSYGVTATDPIHSCRRLFGSKVAMAYGLLAAKEALGHAEITTTTKHYARLLQLTPAVSIAQLGMAGPAPVPTPAPMPAPAATSPAVA